MAEVRPRKRNAWFEDITMTDDLGAIRVKMLLKGGPGVGKTNLMGTAPKLFVIDAESGLLTLFKSTIPSYPLGKKAKGKYYDTCMAILDAIEKGEKVGQVDFSEIESIGLDSISKLNELLMSDIENKAGETNNTQALWGMLNRQISAIMNRLIQLDKHIIVTVGESIKYDENETMYRSLNLRGGYRDQVEHEFDFVLWMNKETSGRGTQYFTTGENMQGRSGKMRGVKLDKKIENPKFSLVFDEIKSQLEMREKVKEEKSVDLALDIKG
jgi:hypothetical protein